MNFQQQTPMQQQQPSGVNNIPTNGEQVYYMSDNAGYGQPPMQPLHHFQQQQTMYFQSQGMPASPQSPALYQSFYDSQVNAYYNQMGRMPHMFYSQPPQPLAFFPQSQGFALHMQPNAYPPQTHQQGRRDSMSNAAQSELFTPMFQPHLMMQQQQQQQQQQWIDPTTHYDNPPPPPQPPLSMPATITAPAPVSKPTVSLIVDPKTNQTVSPLAKSVIAAPIVHPVTEVTPVAKKEVISAAVSLPSLDELNTNLEVITINDIGDATPTTFTCSPVPSSSSPLHVASTPLQPTSAVTDNVEVRTLINRSQTHRNSDRKQTTYARQQISTISRQQSSDTLPIALSPTSLVSPVVQTNHQLVKPPSDSTLEPTPSTNVSLDAYRPPDYSADIQSLSPDLRNTCEVRSPPLPSEISPVPTPVNVQSAAHVIPTMAPVPRTWGPPPTATPAPATKHSDMPPPGAKSYHGADRLSKTSEYVARSSLPSPRYPTPRYSPQNSSSRAPQRGPFPGHARPTPSSATPSSALRHNGPTNATPASTGTAIATSQKSVPRQRTGYAGIASYQAPQTSPSYPANNQHTVRGYRPPAVRSSTLSIVPPAKEQLRGPRPSRDVQQRLQAPPPTPPRGPTPPRTTMWSSLLKKPQEHGAPIPGLTGSQRTPAPPQSPITLSRAPNMPPVNCKPLNDKDSRLTSMLKIIVTIF